MTPLKKTVDVKLESNDLIVSGILTEDNGVKSFEIDSVRTNSSDITSLLESIDVIYTTSRLSSLRNPNSKVKDIWDTIEEIVLDKLK